MSLTPRTALDNLNERLASADLPPIPPALFSPEGKEPMYPVSLHLYLKAPSPYGCRWLLVEVRKNNERATGPGFALLERMDDKWHLRQVLFDGGKGYPELTGELADLALTQV